MQHGQLLREIARWIRDAKREAGNDDMTRRQFQRLKQAFPECTFCFDEVTKQLWHDLPPRYWDTQHNGLPNKEPSTLNITDTAATPPI